MQQPAEEMEKIFAQGKTVGEVTSALLTLSSEKRKILLDFLGYLMLKQKEDQQKQKL